LRTKNLGLQLMRGTALLGSSLFFISGLRFLPIAEASATGFVAPLFVTALSIVFLGESVGLRRWIATAVGLIGVLIILRPGSGAGARSCWKWTASCRRTLDKLHPQRRAAQQPQPASAFARRRAHADKRTGRGSAHTGSAIEYFTWLSAKLDSIEAMPSSRVSLFFRNASYEERSAATTRSK